MSEHSPALFVAHGSPMVAVEDTAYARFLDNLAALLPKPDAIVIFSAHWESDVQMVSDVEEYSTLYDFGGFPQSLYEVTYPAKGDKDVSAAVKELLAAEGIDYGLERDRGLDHGSWTILKRMYPNADIPVVAMSVNPNISPAEQFRIGRALAPLRGRNILIIGSGVTVHNFQLISMRSNPDVHEAVAQFEQWVEDRLHSWDVEAICNYENQAPYAEVAVPPYGKEHFVPLLYAMGAAADVDRPSVEVLHLSWLWNVMSNSVYQFS